MIITTNQINTRSAIARDIPDILELQERNLLANMQQLPNQNLSQGFVTTRLSTEYLTELIDDNCLFCIEVNGSIGGYVAGASWKWFSKWEIFQYMQNELPTFMMDGLEITPDNSYQYGPICIDEKWRGGETLIALFNHIRSSHSKRFKAGVTFINKKNERSMHAHTKKLKLIHIDDFSFGDNDFARLAFASTTT